jgi:hypothetical protein
MRPELSDSEDCPAWVIGSTLDRRRTTTPAALTLNTLRSIVAAAALLNAVVDELAKLIHQSQDGEGFEVREPGVELVDEFAEVGDRVRDLGGRCPDNDGFGGMVDHHIGWRSGVQQDNGTAWETCDCDVGKWKGTDVGPWRVDGVLVAASLAFGDAGGYDALKLEDDLVHIVCCVLQIGQL